MLTKEQRGEHADETCLEQNATFQWHLEIYKKRLCDGAMSASHNVELLAQREKVLDQWR